ncbi:MAG: ABC transporter permease [Rhodocyclaceae bacterium]|nr:ABC transporter permease [Rhodocyclaceae bacterium]MCP5238620.1 ABC transporter permease [Zoogloeaceae bacterium]MCB1910304.1 ABC transporter permease [Rhodocyclaceae bacterium]MCP5254465.1 ABC transporter permease [Zoogloeaceae bacterium]MCP5295669.1 ABC transporter permease [Zoogloeaceae bacterium]
MRNLLSLAWRDLRGGGRTLWVFCACLTLGVALIAASGGLYRQVSASLLADTRALFGGDLEVRVRAPLAEDMLEWMRARGAVSRLIEFRTMLITDTGEAQLVELQSVDDAYPLYGTLRFAPELALAEATAERDGRHGVVLDRVLAERLAVKPGDRIELGDASLEVRALIVRQPDRSLRADWSGPPVLISAAALDATGLLRPGSRPAYRYRVRAEEPDAWRAAFFDAFPDSEAEVRTFLERNARLGEVLGQIGSGVLLIGFSALFIGGLGVFNSVQAYLQGKLGTLATLRALGLRDGRLAAVYLLQILILGGASAVFGALLGGVLALVGSGLVAERLPLSGDWAMLVAPLAMAALFGVVIALLFALPALGRALTVNPAALFRGVLGVVTHTPARAWWLTAGCGLVAAALLLVAMPDPLFGLAFIGALLLVLALLEGGVRLLRTLARRLAGHPALAGRFALRIALSGLYRPDSPLRPTLLSLGSALTLLVASTLVVHALLLTIEETVPERAPALVFYDIGAAQKDDFRTLVAASPSLSQLDLAPLVLGRLAGVGDESLRDSADFRRRLEASDEHKMSTLQNNFDQVVVTRGSWWPDDYRGPALVAMEDREADQLGLKVGDSLHFEIMGERVSAKLAAIYAQKRFQSRLWLEAMFSDGVLDPYITRYVGMAYMDAGEAVAAQNRIAAAQPNVVTVRTAMLLDEARAILERAAAALSAVGGVTLLASLLVLVSVVAASRVRQIYLATLLHTLGARVGAIRTSLYLEYLLLALVTTAFATAVGSALAGLLLHYRLGLDTALGWWVGGLVAAVVSVGALGLGAHHLMRQLRLSPAALLRGFGS